MNTDRKKSSVLSATLYSLLFFGVGGSGLGDRTAVGVCVMLGGFAGVVRGMQPVAMGDMRVVRGLLMILVRMVFGGLAVVGRRVLVMFGGFLVLFSSFVMVHRISSFLENRADAGSAAGSARQINQDCRRAIVTA
jgi:hypothetical protein